MYQLDICGYCTGELLTEGVFLIFKMKFEFSIIGFIVFMLPMIINIIYFMYPPVNNAAAEPASVNKVVEMVEQATRVLYCLSICFLISEQKINFKSPWLFVAIVFLVLYYIVWIRYFICGRDAALLVKSFLGIPQPLAVFPVLYFIFAAIWLHNYIAVIFMIIFGAAHNYVSYISLNK